jgi:sugar-specific transcriptional regulator TrmB
MDIIAGLQELHLTEGEARVYASLLEMGASTPLNISNKTGLKRPTVYLVLESLRRKRLAGLTFRGKKTSYTAEPPSYFLNHLKEEQQTALELLPILKALVRQPEGKPIVRYFDRMEDIEKIWREETGRARQSDYFTNMVELTEQFPNIITDWDQLVRSRRIQRTRTLIPNEKNQLPYLTQKQESQRLRRVFPAGYRFSCDVALWENNVALYSIPKHFMLVITDNALAEVFHSMFELVWSTSLTPDDFLKEVNKDQGKNRAHPRQTKKLQ